MSEIFFLASNQPIKEQSNQAQEILEKGNPIISAWKNRKMDTSMKTYLLTRSMCVVWIFGGVKKM